MIVPPMITLTPADQSITWKLQAGSSGWKFSVSGLPGVVCETSPPSGYAAWPGAAATGDETSWSADANAPNPPTTQRYKYTFNLVNGTQAIHWDPDIENQPQPV